MAVLRELLANVVKHAGASHVDVWVSNQGGACLLVGVRDDGCGFEPPSPEQAVQARQFGLHAASDAAKRAGRVARRPERAGLRDATRRARIPIARAPSRDAAAGSHASPHASCASPGTSNHASKRA